MGYNDTRILKVEYLFKTLKIKLYVEDFQHALENHPGEVSLAKVKSCIENPDKVIQSRQGMNACLFYQMKTDEDYFVVVVHITTPGTGEIKTAYKATYMKMGIVLYNKEKS